MKSKRLFGLKKGKVFTTAELWVSAKVLASLYDIKKEFGFAVMSEEGGPVFSDINLEKFNSVTVELIEDDMAAVMYKGKILFSMGWKFKSKYGVSGSGSYTDEGAKILEDFKKRKEAYNEQEQMRVESGK